MRRLLHGQGGHVKRNVRNPDGSVRGSDINVRESDNREAPRSLARDSARYRPRIRGRFEPVTVDIDDLSARDSVKARHGLDFD
jgi:hypothetical protein